MKVENTRSDEGLAGVRLRPMTTGTNHACAILADDRVICWGENDWEQLGVPGFVSVPFPVFVSGLAAAPINLTAGEEHTCALLEDGRMYCWGLNLYGQLGDGMGRRGEDVPAGWAEPSRTFTAPARARGGASGPPPWKGTARSRGARQ